VEKMILDRKNQMHDWTIIGTEVITKFPETPHTGREYFGYILETPNPGIGNDLLFVIIDKAIAKSILVKNKA
jgi:hypothetical protein